MRCKRHKITQNERFSTIFRGVNASEKTPRDNLCLTAIISIYKKLCFGRAFCFAADVDVLVAPKDIDTACRPRDAHTRNPLALRFVKNSSVMFTFALIYDIMQLLDNIELDKEAYL